MARARIVAACVAVAVSGCGDNEPAQRLVRSGSRVRAMYFVDAQGDRIPRGWFDRELGSACSWTGGPAPRCLPVDRQEPRAFADAGCAHPLLALSPPPAPPDPCAAPLPSFMTVRRDPCVYDATDEVWTVASLVPAPTTVYTLDADTGTCTEDAADPTLDFYQAGDQIPLEHFVGGEVQDVGRGRIRTRTIVADDDALMPLVAYDADLGTACEVDLERGCVPEAPIAGFAEDAACDRPVLAWPTACEPPPYIAKAQDTTPYFASGETWTSDPEHVLDLYDMRFLTSAGWLCSPLQTSVIDGDTLYHAGAQLPGDAFAAVDGERGVGARLAPEYLRAGDHRTTIGWYDLTTQLPCAPAETATDGWRCLPTELHGVWTRFFFSDPACSVPLEVLFHYGDEPDLPGVRGEPVGACGFRTTLRAPGAFLPVGTYFASFDGTTCEAYDPGADVTAYALGPEVRAPRRQSFIGARVAKLVLDLVQPAVRRDRKGGALVTGVERLHEVAPRVHVTATLDDRLAQEALVERARRVGDGEPLAEREHVFGPHLARCRPGRCRLAGTSFSSARSRPATAGPTRWTSRSGP